MVFHEMGPANGQPVILIHGLFSNAQANWINFGHAGKLAAKGRRVIMLARGAEPGKAVLAGMGLKGLLEEVAGDRIDFFRRVLVGAGTHEKSSNEWMAEEFLKTTGGDPKALLCLLDCLPPVPRAALPAFTMPIMVISGAQDQDNGSARALAEEFPDAIYVEVPATTWALRPCPIWETLSHAGSEIDMPCRDVENSDTPESNRCGRWCPRHGLYGVNIGAGPISRIA